jgi:transketolase
MAEQDEAVVLVTADSYRICQKFADRFPDRVFEMGIAEQNACGFCAGLALGGKKPFFSAIAPFVTGRCYEQIRNDLVRPGLSVAIAGRGAGLSYSTGGATHNAVDDLGLLRVLPGITLIDPGDQQDFRSTMLWAAGGHGPVYFRKHKVLPKRINPEGYTFEVGKGVVLQEGKDVTFISSGPMVYQSVLAAEALARNGIAAGVINMHTIKPIDAALIKRVAAATGAVVTVEEHLIYNALGSAVAEVLAEIGGVRQLRIGLDDRFPTSGPYQEVLEYHGLTGPRIAKRVLEFLH